MRRIKVFGERNSGTNYLIRLLWMNCDNELLPGTVPVFVDRLRSELLKDIYFYFTTKRNYGWKHRMVYPEDFEGYDRFEDTLFITITKNPYSYLLSLYDRPHHYRGNVPGKFFDFLNSEWGLRYRDTVGFRRLSSPVELWNVKNSSYLEIVRDYPTQAYNIKYEDLLQTPKETLVKVAGCLGIELHDEFQNVPESTKGDRRKFYDFQYYYLTEQWKKRLKAKDIRTINRRLDENTISRFEYNKIEPK